MGYLQTKLGYFKVDNIIDLFCYISAILVVFDFNPCSQDTGLREDWQWKLGAVAVTITWLNLLSLIRWRNRNTSISHLDKSSGKFHSLESTWSCSSM